jgi:uncharacterized membrane-anchored protein
VGLVVISLILLLLAGGIWFFLSSREGKRSEQGLPRHSGIRLFFATLAILLTIFAGGCSLLFLPDALSGNQYIDPIAVLVIGGIPFALGVLIWWLSLRRNTG